MDTRSSRVGVDLLELHETHVEISVPRPGPEGPEAEAWMWVCACGEGEDDLALPEARHEARRHERRAG